MRKKILFKGKEISITESFKKFGTKITLDRLKENDINEYSEEGDFIEYADGMKIVLTYK